MSTSDTQDNYVGGIYCTSLGHVFSFIDGVRNSSCDCGKLTDD
jgi:hypothetical protein